MAQRPRPFSSNMRLRRAAGSRGDVVLTGDPIASTRDGRDITRPFTKGLQLPRDPQLMTSVDWGVYDEILHDSQVASCLQQRRNAVVSRNWDVVPGDDEDPRSVEAAEALKDMLSAIGWDRITDKMLFAPFYGYQVAELLWDTSGPVWHFDIRVRHARRFRYDDQDRLRLLTRADMLGEILPERNFWVLRAGSSDDDEVYGRGLAEWLYWPTVFKRNGLKFWNNFLDKYGAPTAVGKYPAGTPDAQIVNLLGAMQAIATDTGIAIPDRMMIEFLEATRAGAADYEELVRYCDEAISKIILSQTMTTDDGASRAQGEVHSGVKLEVVRGDADLLSDSFNAGPARWFTDFNFGEDVAAPRVMRDVEEEVDTQRSAATDTSLKALGWIRTDESFQDTYGDGYVRAETTEPAPENPEADEDDPATPPVDLAQFAADDPRPLYVYRRLLNPADLIAWAKKQGFATTLDPEEMHVTITYSRRPVNWFKMGDDWGFYREPLKVKPGGPRMVAQLGDEGAVVLHFADTYLESRHRQMVEAGASWDFPSFLPHVTFTYRAGEIDLDKVEPFIGELRFGPEIFEPIEEDWKERIREVSLAQGDGDYADPTAEASPVDRLVAANQDRVAVAMTGKLFARIAEAQSIEDLQRILDEESDALMDDAPLRESLERAAFALRLEEENREVGDA